MKGHDVHGDQNHRRARLDLLADEIFSEQLTRYQIYVPDKFNVKYVRHSLFEMIGQSIKAFHTWNILSIRILLF